MNIAMEQTEEYVNGQLKNKYGDAFIPGNNGTLKDDLLFYYYYSTFFSPISMTGLSLSCSYLHQYIKEDIGRWGLVLMFIK